ncbi:MAG: hypothetical protein K1Y01_02920 [Vicinamibacteria bacterium]|nr:hypothetical protein [Vicinamibacteria bacterium]
MSGPSDGAPPRDLAAAAELANAVLRARRCEAPIIVGAHCETARSYIFWTQGASGEPLFDAPILAVDKASGRVRYAPEAFYEFFDDDRLNARQKLARWWARRSY